MEEWDFQMCFQSKKMKKKHQISLKCTFGVEGGYIGHAMFYLDKL